MRMQLCTFSVTCLNAIVRCRSSWVKNGDAKCKVKGSTTYEDCVLELEWISSDSGSLDSGTITILNSDGATTIVSQANGT